MEINISLNNDDLKALFKYCTNTIVKKRKKFNLTYIVLVVITINVISIFFHTWLVLEITLLLAISFLSIIFLFNRFSKNKPYEKFSNKTSRVFIDHDLFRYDGMEIIMPPNLNKLIETKEHYFLLFNENYKLKYLILPKRYDDSSKFIENYINLICEKYQIKKELYQ